MRSSMWAVELQLEYAVETCTKLSRCAMLRHSASILRTGVVFCLILSEGSRMEREGGGWVPGMRASVRVIVCLCAASAERGGVREHREQGRDPSAERVIRQRGDREGEKANQHTLP